MQQSYDQVTSALSTLTNYADILFNADKKLIGWAADSVILNRFILPKICGLNSTELAKWFSQTDKLVVLLILKSDKMWLVKLNAGTDHMIDTYNLVHTILSSKHYGKNTNIINHNSTREFCLNFSSKLAINSDFTISDIDRMQQLLQKKNIGSEIVVDDQYIRLKLSNGKELAYVPGMSHGEWNYGTITYPHIVAVLHDQNNLFRSLC